jgi:hypothetical protein
MHTILDLDLDFFVWPPFRRRPEEARLPRSEWEYVASEDEVRSFLEKRCHLSKQTPVPGSEAKQHQEAFNDWSRWIDNDKIIAPFSVVHADAHSDLGSGWLNRSCAFIEKELLAMPVEQRKHPRFGPEYLNSGNYLLGVIANRWISQLTYVYPAYPIEAEPQQPGSPPRLDDNLREMARLLGSNQEPSVSDLPAWIFRNGDWKTQLIELKHDHTGHPLRLRSYENNHPVHLEPPVPFNWVEDREFSHAGLTHIFLAHSPEYTPVEADNLVPIIGEYFSQV